MESDGCVSEISSSEDHPRDDDVNKTSRTSFQQCRSYTFQSLCKFPNQFSRITGFSNAQFNDIIVPAVEPILMEHNVSIFGPPRSSAGVQ